LAALAPAHQPVEAAGTANFVILAVLAAPRWSSPFSCLPVACCGPLRPASDLAGRAPARLGRAGRRLPLLWCIGLITDLQRSEVLSLDKFMHLPFLPPVVSDNYLSSFFQPDAARVPAGDARAGSGMILGKGAAAADVPSWRGSCHVTALTYQFQAGWRRS